METVGEDIVRMQELIHTPVHPAPAWIRDWQIQAEHILHLAQIAKDEGDMNRLRELDAEAKRLVTDREAKLSEQE
jgi:hypothetical protein